ncbi:hypothetical protein SUGI_0717590 [Cryptomeria japonica]|nr:hypothetical protein SUGI_0717590 [Cryptomeria japonica]
MVVRKWSTTKWDIQGSLSNLALLKGLFCFSFSLSEDCVKVLSSGLWLYGKQMLHLRKWYSSHKLDSLLSSVIPKCVCLPSLPLEYLDEEIMEGIANSFGQFIVVD